MDELVKHATEVTQEAEPVEPLLSRQLYDTLRKAAQDDSRDLQETTNDLLSQGRMYRTVYERLRSAKDGARRPVEVTAELLREGFTSEAGNLEERARRSINNLKVGVERAAESVLGDDTEALRLARRELEDLSERLEREIAQARGQTKTNAARGAGASPDERGQQQAANRSNRQGESEGESGREARDPSQRQGNREGESQQQAQNQSQRGQPQPRGESQPEGQGQQGRQPGQGQSGQTQQAASAEQGRTGRGSEPGPR